MFQTARFGHERFGHPELVPLMNDLYAREWSQFTNHFKATFRLLKREKKEGKTKRVYEAEPKTPYQRRLEERRHPGGDEGQATGPTRRIGSLRVEEKH